MNYVTCSPFRVPIARLAAAQAALDEAAAEKPAAKKPAVKKAARRRPPRRSRSREEGSGEEGPGEEAGPPEALIPVLPAAPPPDRAAGPLRSPPASVGGTVRTGAAAGPRRSSAARSRSASRRTGSGVDRPADLLRRLLVVQEEAERRVLVDDAGGRGLHAEGRVLHRRERPLHRRQGSSLVSRRPRPRSVEVISSRFATTPRNRS